MPDSRRLDNLTRINGQLYKLKANLLEDVRGN